MQTCTDDAFSVCMKVQKNEKEPWISAHATRLFGVLYRWINNWTRHQNMECSADDLIAEQDYQPMWKPRLVIEPSVERSMKPTSMLIRTSFSFFWTLIRGHYGH